MTEQHLPLSDRAMELIAHRFKLLSDPTRLRLLQQLMNGEQTVNTLVIAVNSTQANVSKHLGLLADGGLVTRRKDGVHIYYDVADPSLFTLCDLVCRSLQARGEADLQDLQGDDQPDLITRT